MIRWRHGGGGCAPPHVFIPLAEKSDLIVELGLFALRETTAVANKWDLGDKCFVQVNARGLAATIETALTESGLSPS